MLDRAKKEVLIAIKTQSKARKSGQVSYHASNVVNFWRDELEDDDLFEFNKWVRTKKINK